MMNDDNRVISHASTGRLLRRCRLSRCDGFVCFVSGFFIYLKDEGEVFGLKLYVLLCFISMD